MSPFDECCALLEKWTSGCIGVVDLGCGDGGPWKSRVRSPYIGIDLMPGRSIQSDMRNIDEWLGLCRADCAMFADSLEHLTEADAVKLLDALKVSFPRIIAFVPTGIHLQDHGANDPNTHRSTWTKEKLEAHFTHVHEWENFHSDPGWNKSRSAAFCLWQNGDREGLGSLIPI